MIVTLSIKKKQKLKMFLKEILEAKSPTIRQVAALIGKLVSTFPASTHGPIYYRELEHNKVDALEKAKGSYDGSISLTVESKYEISWWLNNIDEMFKPIHLPVVTK